MPVKKVKGGGDIFPLSTPFYTPLVSFVLIFMPTEDGRLVVRHLTEDVLRYPYDQVISKIGIFLVQIDFTPFLTTRTTPS